jgi:hypothetical protein
MFMVLESNKRTVPTSRESLDDVDRASGEMLRTL